MGGHGDPSLRAGLALAWVVVTEVRQRLHRSGAPPRIVASPWQCQTAPPVTPRLATTVSVAGQSGLSYRGGIRLSRRRDVRPAQEAPQY